VNKTCSRGSRPEWKAVLTALGWTVVTLCSLPKVSARPVLLAGGLVETSTVQGGEYVGLSDVARVLKGRYWGADGSFVVLVPGESAGVQECIFRPDSVTAHIRGELVRLPATPKLVDGRLYLPVAMLPLVAPSIHGQQQLAAGDSAPPHTRVRSITRVMLDPGHGGTDPGAVSRRGSHEKRIALDVALRLKKRLQSAGFEVLMTRDADAYVSLADRSKQGNGRKPDIFVSIHINASPNRAACGLETYFLSEAKTDWERAVAARENAVFETVGNGSATAGDELGMILADLAQNEFLWESSALAARIQEATVPHARIRDRGVRQAGFYVLRNTYMPAVLVECGFLSNKSEDKLLRTESHRERLAEGIHRGITAFARAYGGPDQKKTEPAGKPGKK
jgi:N-acetylmuramoyl-L-alanine amidase